MEISLILTSGCCQSIPLSSPPLISSPPFLSSPASSPLFFPLCMRVHVVLKDSDRGIVGSAHGLMINHEEGKKNTTYFDEF